MADAPYDQIIEITNRNSNEQKTETYGSTSPSSMFTLTGPFTPDPRTLHIRFQVFPIRTRLVGPVVLLQKATPPQPATVMLSHKLIFPDGAEVVIAAHCRQLWAGYDGVAFDLPTNQHWQIASAISKGIIHNHGIMR